MLFLFYLLNEKTSITFKWFRRSSINGKYDRFLRVDWGAAIDSVNQKSQTIYKQTRYRPNAKYTQSKLFMQLTLHCAQNIVVNCCVWKCLILRKWLVTKTYDTSKMISEIDSVFIKKQLLNLNHCLNLTHADHPG